MACEISVSQPGIEPVPPAGEAQNPKQWTTREVQEVLISSINSANGIRFQLKVIMGFLGGMNSIPWVEKILWWRKWQPTLVGEWDDRRWDGWMASTTRWTWVWASSRSWWWLVCCRPWGCKELNVTEWLNWTELVFLPEKSHRQRSLLLLLLSRLSRVQLCATPETAVHQAPASLGFSRQEHWSGLPFPSPMHESEKWKWSHSVLSDSQRPHGLQPTRLLRPWDFPGKSTGVGCHCLLQQRSLVGYNP